MRIAAVIVLEIEQSDIERWRFIARNVAITKHERGREPVAAMIVDDAGELLRAR